MIEKFQIRARRKVRPPFSDRISRESNGDNLNVLKRCLDPEMDREGPIWDHK